VRSGGYEDTGLLLSLKRGASIIFVDMEGSLLENPFLRKPRPGSQKAVKDIQRQFPIVILQTGFLSVEAIKAWMRENEFPELPVVSWSQGAIFDEIAERDLKLKAIIANPRVIESSREHKALAFSFAEVEEAKFVKDWEKIASCLSSAKAIELVAVVTDFGTTNFYVGAMLGAMYAVNPQLRIVTITHEVERFNVAEASYILSQAAKEFPSGTVFLAVVGPGLGTESRAIVLQTKDEKLFVAPDNGLLTGVMDTIGISHAYQITNRSLMRKGKISVNFQGRDLYGPVAAHLAGGTNPSEVGPEITDLMRLPIVKTRPEDLEKNLITD